MPFLLTAPPRRFAVSRSDEPSGDWATVLRIADSLIPDLRAAFLQLVHDEGADIAISELQDAIAKGDITRAEALLVTPTFRRGLTDLLTDTLQQGMERAGRAAASSLGDRLGGSVTMRFDLTNPNAVAWVDGHAAELVREISETTRATIRALIRQGLVEGIAPYDTARLLRNVIGLTERQARAASNYEKWLRGLGAGDTSSLTKAEIERLRRGGLRRNQVGGVQTSGLSDSRIAQLSDGYRARLVADRAETIARTETLTASHQGVLEMWTQAQGDDLLPSTAQKIWITTPDDRLCDGCAEVDGQTVGIDEDFDTPYGSVAMPPCHPSCRCSAGIELAGDE